MDFSKILDSGTPQAKTIALTTACFSQAFVTMAMAEIGASSVPVTVTGSTTTGVPVGFDKVFTIENSDGWFSYQVAVKLTSDTNSIAFREVNESEPAKEGSFSVYMNKATGVIKVESREPEHNRNVRLHIVGTLDNSFNLADVDQLHFINGEGSGTSWASLSGPNTGRLLQTSSAAATCTKASACSSAVALVDGGNFGKLITSSSVWFENNSDLSAVGNLVTAKNQEVWMP